MALYPLVRPLAFALDAERAHRLTIAALKLLPAGRPAEPDPVLAVAVAGLDFPNPVGLAAGFDKDAEVFRQMLGFGFGFVEVGTLTPRPQAGNPQAAAVPARRGPGGDQPAWASTIAGQSGGARRGWRGATARARHRRRQYRRQQGQRGPDRRLCGRGARRWRGVADYLTVNISSPNTPGLRDLQDEGRARRAAGRGRRGARRGAADLPQGRARSRARRRSTPSPGSRSTRQDRRADRRQHHDQPAGRSNRGIAARRAACPARR